MNNLIAPAKVLGYSQIYLDFIEQSKNTRQFYPATSLKDVADKLDSIDYNREKIAEILKKQNQEFGASKNTFENIDKLLNKKTVCLFSGQQAGLFGGPLLVIFKALSIVKAAKMYSEELGRIVIPIFWIAGDDHDYEEVNHTWLLDKSSTPIKISYDSNPEIENPTSQLLFDNKAAIADAKNEFKSILGETDFTSELYQIIDSSYTETDSYVTAFGKLMAKLTESTGLIFFNPGDPEAKKMAIDFFKSIVVKQDDLHSYLSETNQLIEKEGYHIQVEKKEDLAHLFYNINGRTPIHRDGDNFIVGEKRLTNKDLLDLIESEPDKFSPDVMTRPVLQSFLFPVISQKGGAAEIAYLAQMNKAFELFNLVTPLYKARPTATTIEKRFEKLMDHYDIKFEELFGDIEDIINRILSLSFPEDIENNFKNLQDNLKDSFKKFSDESLKFDSSLEKFAEQTMGKIDFTMKAFEGKVFSSHKKKSQEVRDKIYKLWQSICTNRTFQERSVNISYFISKYGFKFIDFLYNKIDCEESKHQLIKLSEFEN
jgi:bacillithiol biosynthesis cysteine-adding enzyme BshC